MKQIMLFARDPGGANVLMPVYWKLKETASVSVYGKEFALGSFIKNNIPAKDIGNECGCGSEEEMRCFLERHVPDFLLTGTSLDDYTERYLWKAAERLGIKSAAILDQWMNPGIRFSAYDYSDAEIYQKEKEHPYLPDHIFVMDTFAEKLLLQEGIDAERICVTGQPHFDTVWERYQNAPEQERTDAFRICYASEPIQDNYDRESDETYWGYNEKTNFSALLACLEELSAEFSRQIEFVIRPHPRENSSDWEHLIQTYHHHWIELRIDRESDSFVLLKNVDFICGMSSMFLLEAIICGKPIVSIQIGLKREEPFVLSRLGICKTQLTREQLKSTMRKALTGSGGLPNFVFIKNATERVISRIEKEMEYSG